MKNDSQQQMCSGSLRKLAMTNLRHCLPVRCTQTGATLKQKETSGSIWPHKTKGQIKNKETAERLCAVSLFCFCPLAPNEVQGTSCFL